MSTACQPLDSSGGEPLWPDRIDRQTAAGPRAAEWVRASDGPNPVAARRGGASGPLHSFELPAGRAN